MREINLNISGNKKTEIRNINFIIKWMIRKIPKQPYGKKIKKIVYEGTTSYIYNEEGEEKTENFFIRNENKEIAWNKLHDDIASFITKLENKN